MQQATTNGQTDAQQALQYVLARSATDAAFRAKLVTDAHGALAELAGKDKSEFATTDMSFIEPTADVVIVLPPLMAAEGISDADLEAVSGGTLGTLEKIGEKLLDAFVDVVVTAFEHGEARTS